MQAVADEEPYREKVGWLRCLQGVNTLTALSLLAELYAFERFDSPRKLMSYLGLTPSEESSGQTVRKGPITKAGNRRVRRLLVECGWHQRRRAIGSKVLQARRQGQPAWAVAIAERAQERLFRRYWRLSGKGKPSNKAVTAVARELVGFVWALLQGPPKSVPSGRPPGAEAVSAEPAGRGHPAGAKRRQEKA
jgi:hypothetical protein